MVPVRCIGTTADARYDAAVPFGKLHDEEVNAGSDLVAALVAEQFPDWADYSLDLVDHDGTDHVIYRLGPAMSIRMPRVHWASDQAAKESRWLPVMADLLPLDVPVQLAVGVPSLGYPWSWSVHEWLDGIDVTESVIADSPRAGAMLADITKVLRTLDVSEAPPSNRADLRELDGVMTRYLPDCEGLVDTAAAAALWREVMQTPPAEAPVWIHGDLSSRNLLARNGQLVALIDFGSSGWGDPAADLIAAWDFLTPDGVAAFRDALEVPNAEWLRGRGWALQKGVVGLPYYKESNPTFARYARRLIERSLIG